MRRYPEYKVSGVEWIGEIPKHWETKRNKHVFSERNDRSASGDEELLTVSHITGVSPRSEKNVNMFLARTLEGYKHCAVGNLVINTMWAWMGALGISEFDGIVSPSYNVYRLRNTNCLPRYFDYLYRTPNHVGEIMRWSKGVWHSRLRLYPEAFFRMSTVTPPLPEQHAIASFLDHKTGQIDELIRAKERKIELLGEYRASLIHQAVTKGLDPNVKMKSSGVELIGKIPKKWSLKRLKHVMDLNMGQSPPSEDYNDNQLGTPFLQGCAEFGQHHPTPKIYCETANKHAHYGDILLSVRAPVGEINIADQKYGIGRGLCAIRPRTDQLEQHYAKYLTEAVRTQLDVVATGSTFSAVTVNQVSNITFVVPPLSTQIQIANFLDHKTKQIDELISNEEQTIKLLKEYRQSLISAVVTGKIDVRGEV